MSAKLGQMDNVLQYINKNFITLQDEDKKHYMPHYQNVLDEIVKLMKSEDKLFEAIFQNLYWAGSYYDGLKVGKPEEYDVDVVMTLPVDYKTVQIVNKKVSPPFTKVNMKDLDKLTQHPRWTEVYRHLASWTDKDGFLLQSKFRTWMESAVNKALLKLTKVGNASQMCLNGHTYLITLKKTGPAMTFNITIPGGTKLDVDFVPVIEMKGAQWPPHPVRKNPSLKKDSWFIVPKPNSKIVENYDDTFWRLAFHEQEREMINGKNELKPVCRLLKKFRDTNGLKSIASYYIKTLFLWETIEQKDPAFWRSGLSNQFMSMLRKLYEHIKNKKSGIKYFWDERYDLVSGMSDIERTNVENRLNNIIKDIEKKSPEDPTIIAKYLLNKEELAKFTDRHPRAGATPSPPPTGSENNGLNLRRDLSTPIDSAKPANDDGLLETIMKVLIEQKKITQTILNKVNILQDSIDKLTDENANLRDEIKCLKQVYYGTVADTPKEVDFFSHDDLLDTVPITQVSPDLQNDLESLLTNHNLSSLHANSDLLSLL